MTMGDRIHTLRKDKGLTLEDIGRAAGVAKSTVRKWESGSITSIRTDKVQKVAAALDTTLEYLLTGVTDSGDRKYRLRYADFCGGECRRICGTRH